MSESDNSATGGWGIQLGTAAFFAMLGAALLAWFVTFAQPPERQPRVPFREDYSETTLLGALVPAGFAREIAAIAAAGVPAEGERTVGRPSGSAGCYRTEQLIAETFRAAGLEVMTQEFPVAVPVTEICELQDAQGRPLDGVQLCPFGPAGMLPVAVPTAGITAQLTPVEAAAVRYLAGHQPEDTIAVTYLDAAGDWLSLAAVGTRALIVREDALARQLQAQPDLPGPWSALAPQAEVTFPRFVVRGPIERYFGQRVTLRAKSRWQTRPVRNVMGVLRAAKPRAEALVVTAYYDSTSLVPDLAPGAEEAVSLAALLQYAKALAPYRGELQRDVIFIALAGRAQGLAGTTRLQEALALFPQRQPDYQPLEEREREQTQRIEFAGQARDVLAKMADGQLPAAAWGETTPAFRAWFEQVWSMVAGEIDLKHREQACQARVRHLRAGSPVFRPGFDLLQASDAERGDPANSHPLLQAYIEAKQLETRSASFMSLPLPEAVTRAEFHEWQVASCLTAKLGAIEAYHRAQRRELQDLVAVQRLFAPYRRTLTLSLELNSGGANARPDLALLVGFGNIGNVVEPQVSDLANTIRDKIPHAGTDPAWRVIHWGPADASGSQERPNRITHGATEIDSQVWYAGGRLAFTLANCEFQPAKVGTPEDTFESLKTAMVADQVRAVGQALLAVGFGRVPFKSIPERGQGNGVFKVQGTVFTSAGSAALVPTHRVTGNTYVQVFADGGRHRLVTETRGVQVYPIVPVNPYGDYARPFAFDLGSYGSPASALAARFDDDGHVQYFSDAAQAGQGVFASQSMPSSSLQASGGTEPKPMHIPVFRCQPVALYDRGNPKTLKSFKGVSFLGHLGLAAPNQSYSGTYLEFLKPDFQFYVGLQDGAAGNEEILQYRAFMLNVDPQARAEPDEPEVFGRGYLVADTPLLALPHEDAAASMLRTADKRLALQKRHGMADEQMLAFHARGQDWLAEAASQRAARQPAAAVNAADTSLAYAINNHPVIRNRIAQAVIGILWYLGLLVPFVFFAEKLLFGFTDIRKQLLAVAILFVVVFTLLRLFHPAFEMVRSSLVILLGFVIFLLTLLVTLMVGGKFKQNIKELRRKEGRVEGADINRAGVVGTAFMLGLNNMRRRKVRTGLTSITLVLITFVMICFTSVTTDLVNVEYPTGKSTWNGIMLRNPNYGTLDAAEIANLQRLYGERYPITTWQWVTPILSALLADKLQNPLFVIDRELELASAKTVKRTKLNGAIRMDWSEPQFSGLDRLLLTKRGWFPRPPQTRSEQLAAVAAGYRERRYVMLPDSAAAELGLTPAAVDEGGVRVTIRGEDYEVLGIIDSVALGRVLGLDGQSILPFDLNSVQSLGEQGGQLLVPEDIGHLNGNQVMIMNVLPPLQGTETILNVNCSILLPQSPYKLLTDAAPLPAVDYKEQRRVVLEYLERVGEPAYYAIDGVAYYGSRQRAKTFAGLLELLVPILIAALTVFNTMRGSVYERKEEIYVYNAVGIAPNHVFFIFMAEALVYAVVGAMLGYLLSQGAGRLLTALHLTGGMNMDYSSLETIYASLAIMGATLLSTVLPARDAARMASPSETASWALPPVTGDVMATHLPFTFTGHDRVAVVSYFQRWLDANGAGSSGPFFCAPPTATIREQTGPQGLEPVPLVTSTVWLKPYDLGVSQQVEISLPTDPETGEYIASIKLVRLSGHAAAWQRTVKPFLALLRKQFLNWRVVTPAERTAMFTEAKQLLQREHEHEHEHEHEVRRG